MLSKRSKNPPCSGIKLAKSLTLTYRFTNEKDKSPIIAMIGNVIGIKNDFNHQAFQIGS